MKVSVFLCKRIYVIFSAFVLLFHCLILLLLPVSVRRMLSDERLSLWKILAKLNVYRNKQTFVWNHSSYKNKVKNQKLLIHVHTNAHTLALAYCLQFRVIAVIKLYKEREREQVRVERVFMQFCLKWINCCSCYCCYYVRVYFEICFFFSPLQYTYVCHLL